MARRGQVCRSFASLWEGEDRSAGGHRPSPRVRCGAWAPEVRSFASRWQGEDRSAGLSPLCGKGRAGLQEVIALPPRVRCEAWPPEVRSFASLWEGEGRSAGSVLASGPLYRTRTGLCQRGSRTDLIRDLLSPPLSLVSGRWAQCLYLFMYLCIYLCVHP